MVGANINKYERKIIIAMMQPDKKEAWARSWFAKCLSGLYKDHFSPKQLEQLCEVTGRPDILINYMCDKFGYERPPKKIEISRDNEVKILRQALKERGCDPDRVVGECIREHKHLLSISFKKKKRAR